MHLMGDSDSRSQSWTGPVDFCLLSLCKVKVPLCQPTRDNNRSSSSSNRQPTTVCSSNMYRFHSSNLQLATGNGQRAAGNGQLVAVASTRLPCQVYRSPSLSFPLDFGQQLHFNGQILLYYVLHSLSSIYPWPKSEAVLTLPPTVVTVMRVAAWQGRGNCADKTCTLNQLPLKSS